MNKRSKPIEEKITTKKPKKEKIHLCSFDGCGKKFDTMQHLQDHNWSHTDKKPFLCDFPNCNKGYISVTKLNAHKRIHSSEFPFVCQVKGCDAKFRAKAHLTEHEKIHNEDKRYKCQFCEQSFVQSSQLSAHTRTHTGEKLYVCDFPKCEASFPRLENLTAHQILHTNTKPFSCEWKGCEFKTAQKKYLTKHMNLHTGKRPYVCHFVGCEQTFTFSNSFKSHVEAVHSDVGIQRTKCKKEKKVLKFLIDQGFSVDYQVLITYKCVTGQDSKRRAFLDLIYDRMIDGKRVVFLIEVDEFQHFRDVTLDTWCDEDRMMRILESLKMGNLGANDDSADENTWTAETKIVFVRYNPDPYKVNGTTKRRTDRFEVLKNFLVTYSPQKDTEICYLFYDYDTTQSLPLRVVNNKYRREINELLGKCVY